MRYLTIQKSITNSYFLTETSLKFKSKQRISSYDWQHYDYKLLNSISRAKSNIFRVCYFNRFYYFFTQTISSAYDRTDLNFLIKKLNSITRYLRKKYNNKDFFYLVVPEYHSDEHNWHLHGFLSKAYELDSYINKNGFLSIKSLNKIGFNSVSKIKNYDACIKYATKYIEKSSSTLQKGDRIYYCSNNLKRYNYVDKLILTQIAPIHYHFKNGYCFKTTIDKNKYYNFITKLDCINGISYYSDSTI